MSNVKKKRILFFAETVTLGHFGRSIAIARALHETGKYIIALAADTRCDAVTGEIPFQRLPLESMSCEAFNKNLKKGKCIYDEATLTDYVMADLELINQFQPDFLIGDLRLSLLVSSRLSRIPYATITNAYWSPYADINHPVPDILLVKLLGVTAGQWLFDKVRPLIFKYHAKPLNAVLKKFGVDLIVQDIKEAYTRADYTLYAENEGLIPMNKLPENHFFMEQIFWSTSSAKVADWLAALPTDKPIIFLTMGSSGNDGLLKIMLKALSKMPVIVICATVKKEIECNYDNVHTSPFIPADLAIKKADILICNGGSALVYQGLVANKTVIGIPENLDQYLTTSSVQHQPGYSFIRSSKVSEKAVTHAVQKALQHKSDNPPKSNAALNINTIMNLIDKS